MLKKEHEIAVTEGPLMWHQPCLGENRFDTSSISDTADPATKHILETPAESQAMHIVDIETAQQVKAARNVT
jgi:hypothetical protein